MMDNVMDWIRRLPGDFPDFRFETIREDESYLVMEMVNPHGGENIWFGEDYAPIMGVGPAHCHYYSDETLAEAYEEMKRDVEDYIAGRMFVFNLIRGEKADVSGFRSDPPETSSLRAMLDSIELNDYIVEPFLEEGCTLELIYWDPRRNRTFEGHPDGTMTER